LSFAGVSPPVFPMTLPPSPHVVDHRLLSSEPAGLYIHVPFCQRKCRYCDFYSIDDPSFMPPFLDVLKQEMAMATETFVDTFDSVYVGGGTPTILSGAQLADIIQAAKEWFPVTADAEITIEANPGTVTAEKLAACLGAGVNRINLGVQSFQDDHLSFLGRIHSPEDAKRAIAEARQAGFRQIGIDLMFGLPGQSTDSWEDDLKQALSFAPEHLSCYSLTIEPGTDLFQSHQEGAFRRMSDTRVAELLEMTSVYLTQNGYEHYEISNYCRGSEHRSRHNRKYWQLAPYIGIGPSAHSFVYPNRWWNHRDVSMYADTVSHGNRPTAGHEEISQSQSMMEMIYLGLRDVGGISYDRFHRFFRIRFQDIFKDLLLDLTEENMIEPDERRCRLTLSGKVLLDSIAQRFVDKI